MAYYSWFTELKDGDFPVRYVTVMAQPTVLAMEWTNSYN